MTNAFVLAPSLSLVEEMANHLLSKGTDYSGNLVLFPGKRPGYFLRKIIAERERRALIPPIIHSVDSFIDVIVARESDANTRDIDSLDAVAVLFEVYGSMPHRLGGEHFETLDAFLPLGTRLFVELEELRIARCEPALVRAKVSGLTFGGVHLLAELYERFYAELSARNLRSRSMKYAAAADAFNPEHFGGYSTILVGGFFALTNSEQTLFRKFKEIKALRFFFHQGPYLHAQLEKIGLGVEVIGEELEPAIHLYQMPDQHGEIFALSQVLRSSERKLDEGTVIVLPKASALSPLVHHALADLDSEEYNISLGFGAQSSPLFTLLNLILNVAQTARNGMHHAPSYVNLLRHPYVKNTLFDQRAEVTRVLVHRVEKELSRSAATLYFDLTEFESRAKLFADAASSFANDPEPVGPEELRGHLLRLHGVFIRPFERIDSVHNLAEKCIAALQFVAAESTARLHPLFQPYAQTILESLDQLTRSLIATHSFASIDAYARFLRTHLESAETHFAGTPVRGLQVLGTLETRGLNFTRVLILDVNDDVVPGRAGAESLFIPQPVRELLGLETIDESDHRAEYYFSVLTRGAEEVHLFYVADGKRVRSRLVERFVWNEQQTQGSIAEGRIVARVGYRLSLRNARPEPIEKSEPTMDWLEDLRFSASALDTYLTCGRKFFYKHVLRLGERDEVGEEIGQAEIGTFVHAVLGELASPAINRQLRESDFEEARVDECIAGQFTEHFGKTGFSSHALIREQATRRIKKFLRVYQIPLIRRKQIVVRDVEATLEVPWHDVNFEVRVDRIEERTGATYILDFKTSQRASAKKIRLDKLELDDRATWATGIGSVQLPLYAILYSAISGKPLHEIHPAYLFLGDAELDEHLEQPLFAERSADGYLQIEQFLDTLMKDIKDPQRPFLPPQKLEEVCPRCPFTTLCKTQWVVGWNPSS
jgi:hypothetical protein